MQKLLLSLRYICVPPVVSRIAQLRCKLSFKTGINQHESKAICMHFNFARPRLVFLFTGCTLWGCRGFLFQISLHLLKYFNFCRSFSSLTQLPLATARLYIKCFGKNIRSNSIEQLTVREPELGGEKYRYFLT